MCERIKARLQKNDSDTIRNLKNVDRWKLYEETRNLNEILKYITTKRITETNDLIKVARIVVSENLSFVFKTRKNIVSDSENIHGGKEHKQIR